MQLDAFKDDDRKNPDFLKKLDDYCYKILLT